VVFWNPNCCHEAIFDPAKELRDNFKAKKISVTQFEKEYMQLMKDRNGFT